MNENTVSGQYILIASLAWASHFISLWGGFVFDDSEAIVKNKDVTTYTPFLSVFQHDFWGANISLSSSHKSYRPLTILSYRLNMFFSNNRLDAFQFHTINVVLHGLLSILSLPFFECLLKRNKPRKYLMPFNDPAFTASLLFAVHPIHCEVRRRKKSTLMESLGSVAALVGRADLLASLFFLMIVILYKKHKYLLIWSLMLFFMTAAAVFCKETALSVIGFCFLYDLYTLKKSQNFRNLDLFVRFSILTIIGTTLLWLRLKVMDYEGPTFSPTDNPAAFAEDFITRFLTYNYIYILNGLLLIWPQWLCFDWSMGCVPLVKSFNDWRAAIVIIVYILIATILFKAIFDRKLFQRDNIFNVQFICISLCLLSFLPASNLFFKVGFVIAERVLLLPSAGFCLLVAIGFQKLRNRFENWSPIISIFYILLLMTFTVRCIYRNYEWLNEEHLYKSALEVCPLNAKVYYNIGKIEADKHRATEAISYYKRAIELHPQYEQAMNNLANIYRENGNLNEAEILLRKAVEVRPNFAAAWMNLGIVLSGKGSTCEAEAAYNRAIKFRAHYADAHYNLGNLLLDLGRREEALEEWKEAVRCRPVHLAAWNNVFALLDTQGQAAEAVALGQEALKFLPRSATVHFALGNALGKLNRFPEAEAHFLQAIRLNDSNGLYYSNLGVLYHRSQQPIKAKEMYLKALKIDPNMGSTQTNLEKLENLMATKNSNNKSKFVV